MQLLENISRYKIDKVLGRGAVGTVYKAYDPVIKQTVAIKVIHKQLLEQDDSGEQLKRFRNEVLAGRSLKHPNIVSIYEYGEEQDIAFIIMEFIEGRQLKDFLDEKLNFGLDTTYKIMLQILAALSYAHKKGIVHRDIKPANILVMPNWQIQVADFGIAKIDSSSITQTGMIMGTPNYMSPEQCLGERIDHRADIFSTGVVLYHLLTGKRPFEAETMMGTLQQVLQLNPINPSKLSQQISPSLDKIIQHALAKRPDDRFQSAQEFADALTLAIDSKYFPPDTAEDDATVVIQSAQETKRFSVNNSDATVDKTLNTKSGPTKILNSKWIVFITVGLISLISYSLYKLYIFDEEKKLSNILTTYPCSFIVSSINIGGDITLRGYLLRSDLLALKNDLTQTFGNKKINFHALKEWNATFCKLIDTMSQLKAANDINDTGLKITSAKEDNRYIMDDYLEMNIIMPTYGGYLYVDYFQLNGHVLHMYPTRQEQMVNNEASASISIGQSGQNKRWQVSPPYGVEIFTVIASSVPLFENPRIEDELTESYLDDLKTAIQPKSSNVTAQYLTIETSPQ